MKSRKTLFLSPPGRLVLQVESLRIRIKPNPITSKGLFFQGFLCRRLRFTLLFALLVPRHCHYETDIDT